ncbi:MAG: T9SS type A sorting domain-containing protein, partial [Candidatus Marinimicrobia bacterium]|nr:T9SS type A sorting domain-containing protein [Candidatus Neomarinimicrobiota bacterium]
GATVGGEAFYTLRLIKGRLNDLGAIAGTATDAAGKHLTVSALILAYDADDLVGGSVASDHIATSDSGKYVIPYLPSGNYKILFSPSNADTTYYIETWYDGAMDRESANVVSVMAPDTTTGIDFSVAFGGNIFGIVDFPTGYQTDVYYETEVILYNADGLGEFEDVGYLTFARGFRFRLLTAGTYKLAAIHLLTNLPATYYGGGAFYDANNSTTIALEAENTVHSQWTTLASGAGSVSGTVYHTVDSVYDASLDGFILAYDSTGHILQAAWIGYDSETGAELAAGTYTLPGLVASSYSLRFFGESTELGSDSVLNIWYPYVPLTPIGGEDEGDIYFTVIPTGAIPIEVTTDSLAVAGVDFYLDGYSPPVGTEAAHHGLPTEFALRQNYPNPFNPSTTIQFELPTAADIIITVYDILGREVVRLVEGHREAGYHQVLWQGRTQKGREAATGVYIVRLVIPLSAGVTPGYTRNIKMVLLK